MRAKHLRAMPELKTLETSFCAHSPRSVSSGIFDGLDALWREKSLLRRQDHSP